MPWKKIHPGDKFGDLTVLHEGSTLEYETCSKKRFWCQCECGNKTIVIASSLRTGRTKSCGCATVCARSVYYKRNQTTNKGSNVDWQMRWKTKK